MTDLNTVTIAAATRRVLEKQSKDALDELTPRKVRALVEQELGVEPGTLDEKPYKTAVKDAAADFVNSLNISDANVANGTTAPLEPSPVAAGTKKKPASKPAAKDDAPAKDKKKRKRSSKTVQSDTDDEDEEAALPPPKKAKPKSATKQVATSDEDAPTPPTKKKTKAVPKATPTEKAFGQFMGLINTEMKRDLAEDVASDEEDNNASTSNLGAVVTEFDSDLSSVVDESPVKKTRKKKPKRSPSESKPAKSTAKTATKREKKAPAELDKNEEEIKRLKSFVVACGVRKVWSKEFKDMDKPSQQIAHLKRMLAELGMSGRLSMEKAKSIRAQRELQKELQDVVEFDRKRGSGARRGLEAKAAKPKQAASESENDEEDEDEEVRPARKKLHQSITAFLADQSDDE
ncbi:hypothetical protein EXIGLDRAFT_733322 [Exidia glandulosa HHB12029]|uniref:DEK C-terminal domain-containing protein n=1 Tax=Exidia glandulosa HHB12029 TaxID=1314781 RepID=A0A165KIS4_EXIGL|nr:hypothetical protein EXIGLDRAFT_733322 [Exidia glandulosa HHB12029]